MASPGHIYTLVGFSEEVDRRPLSFVEPLPAAKICDACGFVSKLVGLFTCGHFVCKRCHEQCRLSDKVSCPLDGDCCSEEDVSWISHAAKSVLEKQVLCWNNTNGCNVITPAADISKHFHNECEHHFTTCPQCRAAILVSDVCAHLKSHSGASRIPSTAEVQARPMVFKKQEPLSSTCSDVITSSRPIGKPNSTVLSSIQSQLKEISWAFQIALAATDSDDAHADERNSRQRLLKDSLSRIQNQLAEQNHQLDYFKPSGIARQEVLNFSLLETLEGLKQSLNNAAQTRIDRRALVEQFALLREAILDGQRETKAELATQFAVFRGEMADENNETKNELAAQLASFREAMGDGHRDTKAELSAHFAEFMEVMADGNSEAKAELAAQFTSFREAMRDRHRDTKAELTAEFARIIKAMGDGNSEAKAELAAQFTSFKEAMGDGHRETTAELASQFAGIIKAMGDGNSEAKAELAAQFTSFKEAMGDGHREMKAELVEQFTAIKEVMTDGNSEAKTELTAQFSAFKEAIRDGHDETKVELEGISTAVDCQCIKLRVLLFHTAALFLAIDPDATTHTWTFEKYASLEQRVERQYIAEEMAEPVYLRGYYVSAGLISLKTHRMIRFRFQLHKGKMDPFLKWPFNLRMKLSIVHPQSSEKLEVCTTPWFMCTEAFSRPVNGSNYPISLNGKYFMPLELESQGFVEDGRVLLRLELEPIVEEAQ